MAIYIGVTARRTIPAKLLFAAIATFTVLGIMAPSSSDVTACQRVHSADTCFATLNR